MYTRKSTVGQSEKQWLQLRKTGIGGSDAGAVCGLNPYASPIAVFQDKTSDTIEDQDNEAMRQGRDLEEYVARRFMEATGLKVRRSNCMYRSVEHPWMIADVDRLIVGGTRDWSARRPRPTARISGGTVRYPPTILSSAIITWL